MKTLLAALGVAFSFACAQAQNVVQPNEYVGMLESPSGAGNDWTPFLGTGTTYLQPTAYGGLLVCVANCTSAYSQKWAPWTGASSGGGVSVPASYPNSTPQLTGIRANQSIAVNVAAFTDGSGTVCYTAAPGYASYGCFIDDQWMAYHANPTAFKDSDMANLVTYWFGKQATNSTQQYCNGVTATVPSSMVGALPENISFAGATTFVSGFDQHCAHPTGDGWAVPPKFMFDIWKSTPSLGLSLYTANVSKWITAVSPAVLPQDATTGLVKVTAGDEYIPGTAFKEEMRHTGLVADASVELENDYKLMAQLATAAGDSANAASFTTAAAKIDASLATLIDGTTGLLKADTGALAANLDVQASALFVADGLGTSAQRSAIATYFAAHASPGAGGSLVSSYGYVRNAVTNWAVIGVIPAGGGAPYGSPFSYTAGQYQDGSWSDFNKEFLDAVATVNLSTALSDVQAFVTGPDPTMEYWNLDSTTTGKPNNMESAQADYFFARNNPAAVSSSLFGPCASSSGASFTCGGSTANGNMTWVQNGASSFLGIYDVNSGKYYGLATSSASSPANTVGIIGGWYYGMGIKTAQAFTTSSTFPAFGVNTSNQTNYGVGQNMFHVGVNKVVTTFSNTLDNGSGGVIIPSIKATTGTRYVCVDTSGNITSSASACSGT